VPLRKSEVSTRKKCRKCIPGHLRPPRGGFLNFAPYKSS
jgi:hypothetical protein